jgi:hypothetical protein
MAEAVENIYISDPYRSRHVKVIESVVVEVSPGRESGLGM